MVINITLGFRIRDSPVLFFGTSRASCPKADATIDINIKSIASA
jgi:hypothetical protein